MMPTGLERLAMDRCRFGSRSDLSPYFQQTNSTLRELEFNCLPLDQKCLSKLTNLRELKLESIASVEYLTEILDHNIETLERVELSLTKGLGLCGSALKLIQRMSKLTVLGITELNSGIEDSQIEELFKSIAPRLRKLAVTVDREIMLDLLESGIFNRLQDLQARFPLIHWSRVMSVVMSLKTLRKLEMILINFFPLGQTFNVDNLFVAILTALPLLSELIMALPFSSCFGRGLRQVLRQQKRTLRFRVSQMV